MKTILVWESGFNFKLLSQKNNYNKFWFENVVKVGKLGKCFWKKKHNNLEIFYLKEEILI